MDLAYIDQGNGEVGRLPHHAARPCDLDLLEQDASLNAEYLNGQPHYAWGNGPCRLGDTVLLLGHACLREDAAFVCLQLDSGDLLDVVLGATALLGCQPCPPDLLARNLNEVIMRTMPHLELPLLVL